MKKPLPVTKHILEVIYIVDNDLSVQSHLKDLLKHLNVELKFYTSAENFLNQLPKETYGCLITEVNLPDMNGIELLNHLRKYNQNLPTIFLTNKGSIPTAVKAMQADAVDYIEKPFVERTLFEQVQKALALSKKKQKQLH